MNLGVTKYWRIAVLVILGIVAAILLIGGMRQDQLIIDAHTGAGFREDLKKGRPCFDDKGNEVPNGWTWANAKDGGARCDNGKWVTQPK